MAALLAVLGACAAPKPPPGPAATATAPVRAQALPEERLRDRFIIPGDRIGPVSLRMPLRQLITAMGEPVSSMAALTPGGQPALLYRYADPEASSEGGILVMVRESDQTVYSVQADRVESFQTREGVRYGSSEALVRTSFGKPQSVLRADSAAPQTYCYPAGIAVQMDAKGVVQGLTVFPGRDVRRVCASK